MVLAASLPVIDLRKLGGRVRARTRRSARRTDEDRPIAFGTGDQIDAMDKLQV